MKFGLKTLALAVSLALATPLTACGTFADITAQTGGTTTQQQVTTLAEAINAATIATRVTTAYVRSAQVDNATLLQLKKLNDGVQAALHTWQDAADKNNSVYAASFRAALNAFNAYKESKGIS